MYGAIAGFYNQNIDSSENDRAAAFFHAAFQRWATPGGPEERPIVLDAACGTGECTIRLSGLGYDMIGLDISPEMLQIAASMPGAENIRWILQDMAKMDLFGTVRAVLCTRDSINHLTTKRRLEAFLKRCGLFTEKGGLLVFDYLRGEYFTSEIEGNVFCQEDGDGLCVWSGHFNGKTCVYDVDSFILCEDGRYERSSETVRERIWTDAELEEAVKAAGYSLIGRFGGTDFRRPRKNDRRRWLVARKKIETNGIWKEES